MNTVEAKETKGVLFYALLCACLGVWGYVFHQIAHGFSQVEDPFEAGEQTRPWAARKDRGNLCCR